MAEPKESKQKVFRLVAKKGEEQVDSLLSDIQGQLTKAVVLGKDAQTGSLRVFLAGGITEHEVVWMLEAAKHDILNGLQFSSME